MGGAVSSGRDNNELVDNLMSGHYIRSRKVEKVFRALDRADYMTPEAREEAYKDLAWRSGSLHLSSPCIYSEVMEGLELKPGLSFLNVGSGTGYLSTLVGLILGSSGISHGVEIEPSTVEYSIKKLKMFMDTSPILEEFDFCEPKFFVGNGLTLAPLTCGYDRVYCGAGCPEEYETYFKNLIKVGGILVMPVNDTLLQVKRVRQNKWIARSLLNVSFVTLRTPSREEAINQFKLAELTPSRLEVLSRARIRGCVRTGVLHRHPELTEKPRRRVASKNCPRKIFIPIDPTRDVQNLNALHDLDAESGANEMNALLSLVISMGQNRVAGALRLNDVATVHSDSDGSRRSRAVHSTDDDTDDGSDTTGADAPDEDQNTSVPDQPSTATDNNEQSPKTQDKSESDNTEENKSDQDNSRNLDNEDRDTDSESDSSVVDNLRVKIKQLRARRARKIAKLRRLSKQLSREMGIGRASTSRLGHKRSTTGTDSTTDDEEIHSSEVDDNDNSGAAKHTADDDAENTREQEPGTSTEMEWEMFKPAVENGEVCKSKAKRQKLDSGIGENTPSGEDKSNGSHTSPSDSWEDIDTESSPLRGESRRESERSRARGCAKRRAAEDARRTRLATLVRGALKELPLPPPLHKFVNFGRML